MPEAWEMLPEDILDACDNIERRGDMNEHAKRNLIREGT